jgi:hypothetical protein
MALVVADKVKVRSYGTGTGEFQLETVIPGFQSFSIIGDGNETYYGIEDSAGNWEVGRGTYSTDSTAEYLTRDTVLSSSNNNNPVNFPNGGKTVFCTVPASVLNSIVAGAVSDSFKTISIAGQSNVVADGASDTLTIVAGSNITLTTDAVTDTITIDAIGGIPSALENGSYTVSLGTTGSVTFPGDVTQSQQDSTSCSPSVDTVIYTSTGDLQHAIKLFVMVEGFTDGGGVSWDTQACDIIAVKGYNDNIIHVTAYGVTFSGASAIATFDGQWNATTSRIEITCRPVSVVNSVVASVHAIEMSSND